MLRILSCAALLAASFAAASATTETAHFESVGDADSIPDGVVTALAEDRAGFLWIGTTSGLIRYDGYRLRRHVHERGNPQSLGGNLVRSLLAGRDGRLWIGTDTDGLSMYDPHSETFGNWRHRDDDADSPGDGAIFALAEDVDGHLWIGSRGGGIHRFDPASKRFEHIRRRPDLSDSLPDDQVTALLIDRDRRLWIGTWSGLVRRHDDGSFQTLWPAEGAPRQAIYGLFQANDGRIWLGTREGELAWVDPASGHVQRVEGSGRDSSGGTASVFSFAQPRADELWIGRADGLEIRDPTSGALRTRLRHDPAVSSSLAGNDIRSLLVDRAGLLWTGGYGSGLQRHDAGNRAIRVHRRQPGQHGVLDDPNLTAVLPLADGSLWLGTRGNGVAVLDAQMRLVGGHRPEPGRPGALQAGWITALAQAADGAIWLGSRASLQRFDPASGRFAVHHAQALGGRSVRRLLPDPAGGLWIGTGDGLFHAEPGGRVEGPLPLADGAALGGDINALATDASGDLWVGGARGLHRLPAGGWALQPVTSTGEAGLGHPAVLGLLVDRDDRLWLDTPDGLYRLLDFDGQRARFDPVSERLGIGGEDFGANLLQDEAGRIWTHRHRYDPSDDSSIEGSPSEESLYTLTRADGVDFGTGWFRAYARASDGRLLFGGSQGLLSIDPSGFRPWDYAPPLVVTDLRVQGRSETLAIDGLALPPAARSFSLEFAALDFSAPERNVYRYRLQGFDDDWIVTDSRHRVATYSNLWPGRYLLQIEGSNRTGRFAAPGLEIPIRVLPAWWQTPWFLALLLLVATAAVLAAIRLRTARIQYRAQQLERLVEARTAELSRAFRRTEQALDELRGTQTQLVAAEKMASLGQLVAGVAHEINTPIGIAVTAASHMQETTREQHQRLAAGKLTRSELDQWQQTVEEASRLILGSLQRAHALIGSFKRVAVDQSSEQRRRFELDQFLAEVQFALQPSYRRSPHTLSIDCPPGIVLDSYPGALFQILTNLVTNSLTHAFSDDDTGNMRLSVEPAEDGHVVLRYRDDGCGMPAEVAERAFDPFFTTRRGNGGSGLGLHLVYNLATHLLGGRVDLDSQPGEGTEIVLTLPCRAPEREAAAVE
jgi:ligand-binding sensor domain-containing protein/signal transduction histidine kinase